MHRLVALLAVLTLILTFHYTGSSAAPMSPLDQAKAELNTAKTHAGFAAASDSLNGVFQHTGHATNCLVGANDKRFDKKRVTSARARARAS